MCRCCGLLRRGAVCCVPLQCDDDFVWRFCWRCALPFFGLFVGMVPVCLVAGVGVNAGFIVCGSRAVLKLLGGLLQRDVVVFRFLMSLLGGVWLVVAAYMDVGQ